MQYYFNDIVAGNGRRRMQGSESSTVHCKQYRALTYGCQIIHRFDLSQHRVGRIFFFGRTFDLDFSQTTGSKVKSGAFNPLLTALKGWVQYYTVLRYSPPYTYTGRKECRGTLRGYTLSCQ